MLEQAERPATTLSAAGPAPRALSGHRRARLLLLTGIVVFVAASALVIAQKGVAISRDWLFLWVLAALLALSLADLKRWFFGVIFDWLPIMAVLLFYDMSRGVSEWLGTRTHVFPQMRADEVLFGTPIPTVRLQHAFHPGPKAYWYDYAAWGVYITHFFVTLAVLVLLWRFAYPRFRRFRTMVLGLATIAFVTYVLFPAMPPWLASKEGHLEFTYRIAGDVWNYTGLQTASALFENGSGFYNQVAAVPSLHAAYPVLIMLFFWAGGRWWMRLGLAGYALAMSFTLVYTAEHYVSDILLGWVYAVGVFFAVQAIARRWERRSQGSLMVERPAPDPAALR